MPHYSKPRTNDCWRYWDLADQIHLMDAVALWCGVEPAELASLKFETQCMSAKKAALVAALRDGRLDYEDLGLVTSSGRTIKGAPVDELIDKGRLVIKKPSLRRWFEALDIADRPAFLFDESRQPQLPDGSEQGEMNSLKALALMAHLLARSSNKFGGTGRDVPNAKSIAEAVGELADQYFGPDGHELASFRKKLGKALQLLEHELPAAARGF